MYFLILIILFFIYNTTGLYLMLPFIFSLINFVISTWNLIFNPYNKVYRLIQLISMASIFVIIIFNFKQLILKDNSYELLFIIPLSVNKITFLDSFYWYWKDEINIFFFSQAKYTRFYLHNDNEVSDFLFNLEDDKAYIIELSLIIDWNAYEMGEPTIILSKPILVSKESNSKLISRFINNRVISACLAYSLEFDFENQNLDGPGVLVKYKEINLPI